VVDAVHAGLLACDFNSRAPFPLPVDARIGMASDEMPCRSLTVARQRGFLTRFPSTRTK